MVVMVLWTNHIWLELEYKNETHIKQIEINLFDAARGASVHLINVNEVNAPHQFTVLMT